mgnify:CR=1 FL=1
MPGRRTRGRLPRPRLEHGGLPALGRHRAGAADHGECMLRREAGSDWQDDDAANKGKTPHACLTASWLAFRNLYTVFSLSFGICVLKSTRKTLHLCVVRAQDFVLICSDGTQLPIGRPTAPYTYEHLTAYPVVKDGWIPRCVGERVRACGHGV